MGYGWNKPWVLEDARRGMLFTMSFSTDSPPAGWYPDPAGSGGQRYWDGGTWSQVTRPVDGAAAGQASQQATYIPQGQTSGTPYGQSTYGPSMSRQPVLAGFWWRVLASLLDGLILLFPLSFVQNIVLGDSLDTLTLWMDNYIDAMTNQTAVPMFPDGIWGAYFQAILVAMVLYAVYRTVLVATRGATLGQSIVGLQVVPDGSPAGTVPSWGTSGLRAGVAVVFQYIPILNLVNPLSMLVSEKKQTLHDRIAGTIVIKK